MICGLVNPFITNNNVTARGGRPPVRRRGARREARRRPVVRQRDPAVGRGAPGACSRLEIHLQYRPRLFSCLITPCRLKLNNKIYASQMPPASVVNFYAPLFRAFGAYPFSFLRLFRDWLGCLAGWLSRNFHYYSEILLDDTIITEIYDAKLRGICPLRKVLSRTRMGIFVVHP